MSVMSRLLDEEVGCAINDLKYAERRGRGADFMVQCHISELIWLENDYTATDGFSRKVAGIEYPIWDGRNSTVREGRKSPTRR